jgi:hypothetical protein
VVLSSSYFKDYKNSSSENKKYLAVALDLGKPINFYN